jgi:hypothetical protein
VPHPVGGPGAVAPRKRKGAFWFVLVSLLCLLPVLCCAGLFGYFGWLQPKQERDDNMRVYESLGVPEGFTVNESAFMGELETLEVTYYLLCEKGVCPVNPGEKIHKWLTENKMTNMTLQDVGECLANAVDDTRNELCVFEWNVDGKEVSVHATWASTGDKPEDRQWLLDTEISAPD